MLGIALIASGVLQLSVDELEIMAITIFKLTSALVHDDLQMINTHLFMITSLERGTRMVVCIVSCPVAAILASTSREIQ